MLEGRDFDTIFREFYHTLKLYARRFVLDDALSEDIVQEVFCSIWKMKENFIPGSSIKAYLFSAVYKKCLNYIKHRKIEKKYGEYLSDARKEFERFYLEEITAYERSLLSSELSVSVRAAMAELPDQCHRIFLLSRKFGLKNKEIAEFLQISVKVVERQISKALKIIHDRIIIQA
jgi:RNA polymerase sigma-70 factor (ECF subfamily)